MKPQIFALLLSLVLPGMANAQTQLDHNNTWCTFWKNKKICGSVDDFNLFAERKCLEAQARDNVSVSETIHDWSECLASKIVAGRVGFAITRHDDAIIAKRKLDTLPPGPAWE